MQKHTIVKMQKHKIEMSEKPKMQNRKSLKSV